MGTRWYYQNAGVIPIQGQGQELVFSVAITAVDRDNYILYKMLYLPVRLDSGHLRTVVGRSAVAVNTGTRAAFFPDDCVGSAPMVCFPGCESTHQTCEAALIAGSMPHACTVKITSVEQTTATVLPLASAKHLVAVANHVPSLRIHLRCQKQPQVVFVVAHPKVIMVPVGCHLEGPGWHLKGVQYGHLNITFVTHQILTLPKINYSWPTTMNPKVRDHLRLSKEINIPLLSFADIVSVDAPGWVIPTHTTVTYTLLGVFGLLGTVVSMCICRKLWKVRMGRMAKALRPTGRIYWPGRMGSGDTRISQVAIKEVDETELDRLTVTPVPVQPRPMILGPLPPVHPQVRVERLAN